MGSGYGDAADHFDQNHVPPDYTSRREVLGYLEDNFRDETVPMKMKHALADKISEKRTGRDAGEMRPDSGHYYDPDSGAWREGGSGQFSGGPDE